MKSRIAIDLDEDNAPIIQITWRDSDDVRDKMVKRFLEAFGYDSSLAQFVFTSGPADGEASAKIRPIGPLEYRAIVDSTS